MSKVKSSTCLSVWMDGHHLAEGKQNAKEMKGRIKETFLFSEPGQERATVNTERVSQASHQRKKFAYMQELLRRMILILLGPKQISLWPFSQRIVPPLLSKDLWFGC